MKSEKLKVKSEKLAAMLYSFFIFHFSLFTSFFLLIFLTAILFTACKKSTGYTITTTTSDSGMQTIIASDEFNVNNEMEQAVNDALLATSISPTTSGESVSSGSGNLLYTTIFKAGIDTSKADSGLIKIIYFGINLAGTKSRTGEVDIQLAVDTGRVVPWKTTGALATVTFKQYEVTYLADTNKTLWMNGAGTINNVSGGLLKDIAAPDSLVDKLTAQLAFTYNDNPVITTWTWNFNRLRVFHIQDTTVTMSITGDTTINSTPNVATWGMTRFNQSFYSTITTPILENIYGSGFLYNPLSGAEVIHGITEPITITYGVDQQGNAVTTGNPYGYGFTWTNTSGQGEHIVVSY